MNSNEEERGGGERVINILAVAAFKSLQLVAASPRLLNVSDILLDVTASLVQPLWDQTHATPAVQRQRSWTCPSDVYTLLLNCYNWTSAQTGQRGAAGLNRRCNTGDTGHGQMLSTDNA
jgi:hypothetical protein